MCTASDQQADLFRAPICFGSSSGTALWGRKGEDPASEALTEHGPDNGSLSASASDSPQSGLIPLRSYTLLLCLAILPFPCLKIWTQNAWSPNTRHLDEGDFVGWPSHKHKFQTTTKPRNHSPQSSSSSSFLSRRLITFRRKSIGLR